MLMPARAVDSGRNAPKAIISGGGRVGHLFSGSKLSTEKHCCDGFGKVLSDEHIKQFEQKMNKYHHHYYGPQIPGILEYQRVYNKFTPTPFVPPQSVSGKEMYSNNMNPGKPLWNGMGVLNGPTQASSRFELPESLKMKIFKIINEP